MEKKHLKSVFLGFKKEKNCVEFVISLDKTRILM